MPAYPGETPDSPQGKIIPQGIYAMVSKLTINWTGLRTVMPSTSGVTNYIFRGPDYSGLVTL